MKAPVSRRAVALLIAGGRGARVKAIVAYCPVTDVARWKATTTNPDIPGYIEQVCEPGAQHGFTAEQQAVARPIVDAFLARWLE